MCETEDNSNSGGSGREGTNSQISNIFDYISDKMSSSMYRKISKDHSIQMNEGSDIYSVEREICTTQLDDVHEEELLVEQLEYFVPPTTNYKFSKMFDTSSKRDDNSFSYSFNNKMGADANASLVPKANTSRNNLKSTQSKSLTFLDYSSTNCLKNETIQNQQAQANEPQAIKKYSDTFLNNENTLQELHQQNMLAQDLLKKYFSEDKPQIKIDDKREQKDLINALNPEEKKLETVSSLMRRYFSRIDENEQVCIKPSDEYVFLNTNRTKKKNSCNRKVSVKVVRPFKYHKKFWDSGSNFEVIPKTQSPFYFQGPRRKRSRFDFESTVALKQNSSTDMSLKTENVQFISTKDRHRRQSDSESNKLLYKTDSKNFENTFSAEELHTFMPERYMSLRNVYGPNYIKDAKEQNRAEQNKPRYNFQTLQNKGSKSQELILKFLDSGSHIKVTDDDYKKWLKEKNFLKYVDLGKSSVSSITFKSISQKVVNYSIGRVSKPSRHRKTSRSNVVNKSYQIGFNKFANAKTMPSLTNSVENFKFVDIEYNNFYQLFIYEHIVISNFINFYCSFNATRIKKLTITDRVYQLIFLVFCYYILSLMNNVFNSLGENWF